MAYLVTAVVLVGAVGALNLLLLVGVIRRLRVHSQRLVEVPGFRPLSTLTPGSQIASFTATTVDGMTVSRDALTAGTLVGFFSTSCSGCQTELPRFVERAAGRRGGDRAMAVVAGPPGAAPAMVPALSAVARVICEEARGPVADAFGVRGYPVVFALDGDTVVAHAPGVQALPAGAVA